MSHQYSLPLPVSSQVGIGPEDLPSPCWPNQSQPRKMPHSSENLRCLPEAHFSGPQTNPDLCQMLHLKPTVSLPSRLAPPNQHCFPVLVRCQEVAVGLHLEAEVGFSFTIPSYWGLISIEETPKLDQQPVEEDGYMRLVPFSLISCPFTFSPPDGQARDHTACLLPKPTIAHTQPLVLHILGLPGQASFKQIHQGCSISRA